MGQWLFASLQAQQLLDTNGGKVLSRNGGPEMNSVY